MKVGSDTLFHANHCSKHPGTDMSKRLLILEQAQVGTIKIERFRKLYGAHAGGRTENMDD